MLKKKLKNFRLLHFVRLLGHWSASLECADVGPVALDTSALYNLSHLALASLHLISSWETRVKSKVKAKKNRNRAGKQRENGDKKDFCVEEEFSVLLSGSLHGKHPWGRKLRIPTLGISLLWCLTCRFHDRKKPKTEPSLHGKRRRNARALLKNQHIDQ